MRIITPDISYLRSISWTKTSKCVICRKCLLVTRVCKSARSEENETANGQKVLLPQRLRCDAFISFQPSTNPGVVRRPRSTQDDFHRTKCCLRGLPRPCLYLFRRLSLLPTLLLADDDHPRLSACKPHPTITFCISFKAGRVGRGGPRVRGVVGSGRCIAADVQFVSHLSFLVGRKWWRKAATFRTTLLGRLLASGRPTLLLRGTQQKRIVLVVIPVRFFFFVVRLSLFVVPPVSLGLTGFPWPYRLWDRAQHSCDPRRLTRRRRLFALLAEGWASGSTIC